MASRDPEAKKLALMRRRLLNWYDRHRRDLPWRKSRDPYAIWVSEIMLQQTRVAAVVDRYRAFLDRFPTVGSLAAAREEEVLALWSGLGYYRRARMLHKAAQRVAGLDGGRLPGTAGELRQLPGIGKYTAAAIASIAFGERVAVVDGNVERVLCRVKGLAGSAKTSTALRKKIERMAGCLIDIKRPGDSNQALMELGATVCMPRNPQCQVCPIVEHCKTRGVHKTAPRNPMRSVETGYALAVRAVGRKHRRERREVLLGRRPEEQTVMPGLWELPALRKNQVPEGELCMTIRHATMQVNHLVRIRSVAEKDVKLLTVKTGESRWVPLDQVETLPLTGLARKVLIRAGLLDRFSRSQTAI